MTRKKVQLSYIACDSARKSTYKKRKKGILKKIDELSTLCGVEACAVIYSPYEPDPVVWPDNERAQRVVERFRRLPEMDQHRKMFDHPGYLRQRVGKTGQTLTRLQRENREREVALTMYGCLSGRVGLDGLSLIDLSDLGWMIDRTLKEIGIKLEAMGLGENNNDNNDDGDDEGNQGEVVVVGPQPVMQEVMPMWVPPPGYVGLRTEEVGPGLGHFLGLGFGNIEMQLGPPFWPYYPVAPRGFDGASTSGGDGASTSGGDGGDGGAGDNMPPSFGSFFH